jgi:hypothetical protein
VIQLVEAKDTGLGCISFVRDTSVGILTVYLLLPGTTITAKAFYTRANTKPTISDKHNEIRLWFVNIIIMILVLFDITTYIGFSVTF